MAEPMTALKSLLHRGGAAQERAGFALYAAAVAAARDPCFFARLGVPDTLDGRFDLVAVFAFLLIERLQPAVPPGPELAQKVFDAMFTDMDVTLREIGVGDLSVGRKVRAMWEAFHGRALAYRAALATPPEDPALEAALARNVWRGVTPPAGPPSPPAVGAAAALARIVRAQAAALAGQDLAALAAGNVHFPPSAGL